MEKPVADGVDAGEIPAMEDFCFETKPPCPCVPVTVLCQNVQPNSPSHVFVIRQGDPIQVLRDEVKVHFGLEKDFELMLGGEVFKNAVQLKKTERNVVEVHFI